MEMYLRPIIQEDGVSFILRNTPVMMMQERGKNRSRVGMAVMHLKNLSADLPDRLMVGRRILDPSI